ncbi:MAG: sulfatase, partial [Ekhidna sp.]
MQVFSKISIFTILLLFKAYSVLAGDPKKIIFIFIDDLRPDIGIYGNDKIYTPTLDSLGKAGTVFENAYCQQALCSPSRSSILTGVRPDSIKVNDLSTHFRSSVPEIKTIPQFFKDKGYLSAGFGKIFHGKSLDDSLSWSNESYYPPRLLWVNESNLKIRDSLIALGSKLPYSYPYERGESEDNDDYRDGLITSKVIDYIRNHQSDSFFLALGYYKPHLPFSCPSKYWDIYDSINFSFDVPNNWPENSFDFVTSEFEELRNYFGIPATGRITDEKTILNLRQGYYACISFVDDQLRRLFNELRNLGLANDVTIVLVGDHGYKLGEYGSWAKHTNYGIDTRIPLMFTGPSIPAMKVPDVVEGIDIFPTLVDLYFDDFQDSNFEGQSLVPAFEDKGLSKDYAISQFP